MHQRWMMDHQASKMRAKQSDNKQRIRYRFERVKIDIEHSGAYWFDVPFGSWGPGLFWQKTSSTFELTFHRSWREPLELVPFHITSGNSLPLGKSLHHNNQHRLELLGYLLSEDPPRSLHILQDWTRRRIWNEQDSSPCRPSAAGDNHIQPAQVPPEEPHQVLGLVEPSWAKEGECCCSVSIGWLLFVVVFFVSRQQAYT